MHPTAPIRTTLTTDVVIIGAGPGGCAAAIAARRGGLDVVVVDRAQFPRDKICGDGLTASALRELEALGLDPRMVPSWISVDDVTVRSPGGREVVLPLPDDGATFAAVARRTDLDAALVALAERSGARVLQGHALSSIDVSDHEVIAHVDVADGPSTRIVARHAIAADGMWSPTRKAMGLEEPGYRGEWHAFRQYVRGVSDRAARELVVWFEPDLLPGYAWSFPLGDGSANLGFGILRGGDGYRVPDMAQVWRELLTRPHVRGFLGPDATLEGPPRAWPIPARVGRTRLTSHRVLFVGDAARAADPMTGEGIGQALQTGRWAAEAVVAHDRQPLLVARAYELAVRDELAIDHRFAERQGSVLRHPLGARLALGIVGATGWTRRNFGRWLFEGYPRALVLTPSRWAPGALTAPGAYGDADAHPSD